MPPRTRLSQGVRCASVPQKLELTCNSIFTSQTGETQAPRPSTSTDDVMEGRQKPRERHEDLNALKTIDFFLLQFLAQS